MHRCLGLRVAALCCAGALAACGTPPELNPTPAPPTGSPSATSTAPPTTSAPVPTQPVPTTPVPTPTFAEGFAVPCAGRPDGEQVVRVLRRKGLINRGAKVTITVGPLCAGTWQYTELDVIGREPLSVVTKGPPDDLTLVTAGSDVCSIPVRTAAPPGIRTAAACL